MRCIVVNEMFGFSLHADIVSPFLRGCPTFFELSGSCPFGQFEKNGRIIRF